MNDNILFFKNSKERNEYHKKHYESNVFSVAYNEDLISDEDLHALDIKYTCLATRLPNHFDYAISWYEFSLSQNLNAYIVPTFEEACNLLPSLSNKSIGELKWRNNCELLFIKIFQAKCIFEPLIFIESGLRINKDRTCFKSTKYLSNSYDLLARLKKDICSYKKNLDNFNFLKPFSEYTQALPVFDGYTSTSDNKISRAQHAFIMMMISGLPEKVRPLALFQCRPHMSEHIQERTTRVAIHTLSCIIYSLLLDHAKNTRQEGIANSRGLTARIISEFSPKKENGQPCYQITERGVEFAMTGH